MKTNNIELNGSDLQSGRFASAPLSYGSSVTLNEALRVSKEQIVKPEYNKTYIQSLASTKGPGGEIDVRNYHEQLLTEQNAELLTKCLHLERQAAAELDGIDRQIEAVSKIHERTKRYQEAADDSTPWTITDKIEVAALGFFSLILLWVGVNNVAQVLRASGIPGFESLWRCYLFSMAPVGLAFLFKCVGRLLPQPKQKTLYLLFIWGCGLTCGTLWIFLFAKTFPGFTQSVSDIINSLNVTQTQTSSGAVEGKWFIFFSIFTEVFLAAGCWLTIERIMVRHEAPRRKANPAHEISQTDLNQWIKRKYEQEELRSQIQGKIRRVEDAKRCFGEEAVGFFHLALRAVVQTREINNLFKS